ncbi:alanine--glyoxylate aminotransferase [Anthonomus grandis grandis]|uniref:alanine--glyoxylate aminotransferase n=1 Tax=Anthonomus grandis grandis TaxID=2921223 RepID=UPI002165A342|nr:alanine--glyoxylate aminotransferase [Anthonomus grandis grandis]
MENQTIPPPVELKNPLVVSHKLLMGPGPSNACPRVLQALSQPVLGHMHTELFQIMDDIKIGMRYLFQTRSNLTLALSSSGHSGMEAVICNLLEPADKMLILIGGIWGERASDMAKRHGVQVEILKKELNRPVSLIEIDSAVSRFRPKLLFVVQGESSTGIYQDVEGIGEITRRYNCLLAVDTVASLGSVPLYMDLWNIDVVYTGCQKIIGVPPGLTPISFNERAQKVIFNRKTPIQSYYLDMTLLGQQWNCFSKDLSRVYHHTTCANLLYGLREGIAILVEEQLENTIKRHQTCAQRLYRGLEKLGLEFYVEEEHHRLPSVTTVNVPKDVDWKNVLAYAMKNYRMEISGGLGPTAGKVFRIGIMGYNATPENIDGTLQVLKEALEYSRNHSKL